MQQEPILTVFWLIAYRCVWIGIAMSYLLNVVLGVRFLDKAFKRISWRCYLETIFFGCFFYSGSLGKYFTIWAILLPFFALVIFQISYHNFGSNKDPPTSASCVAGITDKSHEIWLVFWDKCLANILPGKNEITIL
jgi:hypothetical protein